MNKSIVGTKNVTDLIKEDLLKGFDISNVKWLAYANNSFYYLEKSVDPKLKVMDNISLTDEEVQKVMFEIHELTNNKRVKKNRTILVTEEHHIIHSSNYVDSFKSNKSINKLVTKHTGRSIDRGSVTLEIWYNVYKDIVNSDYKTS